MAKTTILKKWYVTIFLFLFTVILGILTWNTTNQRVHWVVQNVSGDEAIQWVERAKKEKWVEIVIPEFNNREVNYIPVPKNEIDKHVKTESYIYVRTWMKDETVNMIVTLANMINRSDLDEFTQDIYDKDLKKQKKIFWFKLATVVFVISTMTSGYSTFRKFKK